MAAMEVLTLEGATRADVLSTPLMVAVAVAMVRKAAGVNRGWAEDATAATTALGSSRANQVGLQDIAMNVLVLLIIKVRAEEVARIAFSEVQTTIPVLDSIMF